MVERYHPTSDSISLIVPHSRGDYVRYSDYAALEAENARVWGLLAEAAKALDAIERYGRAGDE